MGRQTTASEPRRLGIPLGMAIIAVPLVFGWFALLPGYSRSTRRAAAAWMVYGILLACVSLTAYG